MWISRLAASRIASRVDRPSLVLPLFSVVLVPICTDQSVQTIHRHGAVRQGFVGTVGYFRCLESHPRRRIHESRAAPESPESGIVRLALIAEKPVDGAQVH